MNLQDTTIGSKIKVFWGEDNFRGISTHPEKYSFPATVIWFNYKSREWLLAWTKDQQHPQLYSHPIETFYGIATIIPDEFKGGYGRWLSDNAYIELDYFNEKQACKICLLSAPHINTFGQEFVCKVCQTLVSIS